MAKLLLSFLAGITLGALGLNLLQGDSDLPQSAPFEAHIMGDEEENEESSKTQTPLSGSHFSDIDEKTCEEALHMVRQAHADAIRRFSENEDLVDHLTEMLDRTALDRPLRFPEFLDDRFQPEGVLAAMDELMDECPELFPADQTVVDCSEYPCFIEAPFEGRVQGFDFAATCSTIHERLGAGATTLQISAGEQSRLIYAPFGEGIGLNGFLRENDARHRVRMRMRGQERRQELAQDTHEEACLVEGDANACRRLANAFQATPEKHLFYLQAGCDTHDAEACRLFAYHSCFTHGRCDAEAEARARQALTIDPSNGAAHYALAIILCQQHRSTANSHFQQACANGYDDACGRSC